MYVHVHAGVHVYSVLEYSPQPYPNPDPNPDPNPSPSPSPSPSPRSHPSQVRELSAEEKAALYEACLPDGALLGAHARRASAMAAARARTIGTTEDSKQRR